MLQWAVEIEFVTIPPYLCALWSIARHPSTPPDKVYFAIRDVVLEEMGHFGLSCNLLNTLGEGPPHIKQRAPIYPRRALPGGVCPQVRLSLGGLTMEALDRTFMQIEFPQYGPLELHRGRGYPTIGRFYSSILRRLEADPSVIKGINQVTYSGSGVDIWPINCIDDAKIAITTIKEQGEGTTATPYPDNDESKPPAHYYRFGEIYHQRRITLTTEGWDYLGDSLPFPATLPVVQVPHGGYDTDNVNSFDCEYSKFVDKLQLVFETADNRLLEYSVEDMKNLAISGIAITTTPLPEGGGNYCPCFRYRAIS
jgi:hypothetical protein